MRRTAAVRWSAVLLLLAAGGVALSGCGKDSSNSGSGAPADVANLSEPGLDLSGGGATSPGGTGGDGGVFTSRSDRAFVVTSDPVPDPPASSAIVNHVTDLNSDQVFTGTTEISGNLTSAGSGIRSITVNGGDLIVSGSMERTDPAAGFSLSASGSLQVTGTIETIGGAVTLRGSGIDVRGTIQTNGVGAVSDADGVQGGSAGAISIEGSGVVVTGAVRFRGGRAWTSGSGAVGGEGGQLSLRGSTVRIFGTLDGRGGNASASAEGTGVNGGRGGRITLGGSTPATSITIRKGRFSAGGGSGDRTGGQGGMFDLLASTDGIDLDGTFAVEGGSSPTAGGAGGLFKAMCDVVGGDLQSGATVLVTGGAGGSGGAGGRIELSAWFDPSTASGGSGGSILLSSASALTADGGSSAGASAAGKGGTVHLEIPEARVSISGLVAARGGSAHGSGKGGLGGFLWVDSDANANALGGDIVVESGAMLDASGGASASGTGGDAQWSATPDMFNPEVIPVAVLLDGDSVLGGPNAGALIQNNGTVVARGAKAGGHGGDVYFHGKSASSREPDRGDVQNEGEGGSGVFTSD